MAQQKRSRDEAETYESDGGFVSNDDGNAPKWKKSKKAGVSKPHSGGDDRFWAVSISSFSGSSSQDLIILFIAFIWQKSSKSQCHRFQEQQIDQHPRVLRER
jgi:hypothetical protein